MNFLSGETVSLQSCPASNSSSVSVGNLTSNDMTMLCHLASNKDVLVKSQQRGEEDLSLDQKLDVLKEIFESSPVAFLNRFGDKLEINHLNCFDDLQKNNEEVELYIIKLRESLKPSTRKLRTKNRRYEALKKLVETTDYFSEEEMQRRNPILYDQLIGRFHTEDERAAFLHQSSKSTSGAFATPLVDMFMAHMDRDQGCVSNRREDQEEQMNQENVADEEYLDDDDDDEEDEANDQEMTEEERVRNEKFTRPPRRKKFDDPQKPNQEEEEIEDDEKELFKEEFFTTMYRNFLEGKDQDFDYTTVDDNPEYDCTETLEEDEQDKYFDTEEPCEIQDEDMSSGSSVSSAAGVLVPGKFCHPKHNKDKFQFNQDKKAKESTSSELRNPNDIDNDDGEEDELDVYMKTIEKELDKDKKT